MSLSGQPSNTWSAFALAVAACFQKPPPSPAPPV